MKILHAGFEQETNSFSPVIYDESKFSGGFNNPANLGYTYLDANRGKRLAVRGMIDAVERRGDEIIPVVNLRSNSGGPVTQELADKFVAAVLEAYDREMPEGIYFTFHAGMQLTENEDGIGYILEKIREHTGDRPVICMSSDLHANITPKIMDNANIVCGYQTYPHWDFVEVAERAAGLAYRLFDNKPTVQSMVRVPMIIQAETYDDLRGPFADLIKEGHSLVDSGKILDFSFYMMQPWLDVSCGGSSIIITAEEKETADQYADYFAKKLYDLRKVLDLKLYGLDEVIDLAINNTTDKPVILVDSADSQGAGSEADSTEVLRRLVERDFPVKAALFIHDEAAVDQAFEVGVGNEAEFTVGGKYDKVFQRPYTFKGYVKALFDGKYILEGPAGKGNPCNVLGAAVVQLGNIDILLVRRPGPNYDAQSYRAFGIEPTMNRLVVVKSATMYKLCFEKFTTLFYPTDTPGASSANLKAMPFKSLPKYFWPFEDHETFDMTKYYAKKR